MNPRSGFTAFRLAIIAVAAILVHVQVALAAPISGPTLYLSTGADRHIYSYSPTGVRSTYANFGGIGYNVEGLAFDAHGNLFVAFASFNFGNSYIEEITPSGVQSMFATGLNAPTGLAFDAAGNLFVGDYTVVGNGTIYKYSPDGMRTTFFTGLAYPQYNIPFNLAFDSKGNLFVAAGNSSGNNNGGRILEITPTGSATTFAANFFTGPMGLAFDASGNLCTTDNFSTVYKFSPNGVSSLEASISFPRTGLAVDSRGDVFVGSYANGVPGAIYEIASNGTESTFASNLAETNYLTFGPAPEPSTLILLGLGLVGMIGWSISGRQLKASRVANS